MSCLLPAMGLRRSGALAARATPTGCCTPPPLGGVGSGRLGHSRCPSGGAARKSPEPRFSAFAESSHCLRNPLRTSCRSIPPAKCHSGNARGYSGKTSAGKAQKHIIDSGLAGSKSWAPCPFDFRLSARGCPRHASYPLSIQRVLLSHPCLSECRTLLRLCKSH